MAWWRNSMYSLENYKILTICYMYMKYRVNSFLLMGYFINHLSITKFSPWTDLLCTWEQTLELEQTLKRTLSADKKKSCTGLTYLRFNSNWFYYLLTQGLNKWWCFFYHLFSLYHAFYIICERNHPGFWNLRFHSVIIYKILKCYNCMNKFRIIKIELSLRGWF